jgi:hypothetical protein
LALGQPHARALAVQGRRHKIMLATKFGNVRTADGAFVGINGKPDYVRSACDASLRRLKVDMIDLYYQHRVDPATPIEDTVAALADLVKAGKIRHIGLSEVGPGTIRRAHAGYGGGELSLREGRLIAPIRGDVGEVKRVGVSLIAERCAVAHQYYVSARSQGLGKSTSVGNRGCLLRALCGLGRGRYHEAG